MSENRHVAYISRPCLLIYCTPLHNIRYGISLYLYERSKAVGVQ